MRFGLTFFAVLFFVPIAAIAGLGFPGIGGGGSPTSGSGGSGIANQAVITQTQSFTLGECLYNDGTGSTSAPHYSAADNSAVGTAHVDGTVTATGATSFTITFGGYENTISGLTAGKQYYLGTAGALTSTAPVSTTAFLTTVLYTGVSGDGVVEIGAPQSLALISPASIAAGALANGMTATTQSVADNTTKIATDAFVLANAGGLSGGTNTQVVYFTGATTTGSNSGFTSDTSGNVSGLTFTATTGRVTAAAGFSVSGSGSWNNAIFWSGFSHFYSAADGFLSMENSSDNGFTALIFGPTSASFPGIFTNSGTTFAFRLANNSADAPITAAAATFSGAITETGALNAGTVTLSAGAGTITSASIATASTIILTRVTASGTAVQPLVTANAGTATVAGAATDNGTYNWRLLK